MPNNIPEGIGSLIESETDVETSSTDLFLPPINELSLQSAVEYDVRPLSENSTGPFEFLIPQETSLYIDPSSFRLSGEISMKKVSAGGVLSNISDDDKVSVCNFTPHSLFRSAEVYINGRCMSYIASPKLCLKTVMEIMLSYGNDAARTHLSAVGWDPDEKSDGEPSYDAVSTNVGWKNRKSRLIGGKKMDFCINLHLDILNVERLLPDFVNMKVILQRNKDDYTIMADKEFAKDKSFQLELHNLVLHYRKITLNQSKHESIQRIFSSGKRAIYPLTRTQFKTHALPQGQTDVKIYNLFPGPIQPKSIYVAFLDTAAFTGTPTSNPYELKHYGINSIQMTTNGRQMPIRPLKLNLENDNFMRAYRWLFDNCGVQHANTGNLVTPARYKNGFTVFAFDNSPDKCGMFHRHIAQNGSVDFDLTFKTAIPAGAMAVFHATYDDTFEINSDGIAYMQSGVLTV